MVKYGKTQERSLSSSSDSSVSSSSDSEYYSPEEIVGKNSKHHKVGRSPNAKKKNSNVHKLRMSDAPVGGDSASTGNENNDTVGLDFEEFKAVMEKNQQLEKIVSDLTRERQQTLQTFINEMQGVFGECRNLPDTEVDFFSLVKKEVMGLKFQLDSTDKENQELKEYTARLGDENAALRARIDELEMLPRPHCDDANAVTEALQSRVEELIAQVKDLQQRKEKLEEEMLQSTRTDEEVIILENQNKELVAKIMLYEERNETRYILESGLDAQIGDLRDKNKKLEEDIVSSKTDKERLMDEIGAMQLEIESLNREKRDVIEQINTIQVERLKDEMSRWREDEKRVLESQARIENLESQINSSNKQKCEMEVMLKETSEENCELKEKMKELEKKIYDLERNLVQRGDKVSELERETSELCTKLSIRDEEFNSLQSQKAQLEVKIGRGREQEATGLNNGISSKEYEKIKGWFKGSKPSLQVIERKMEELVEEFRKHMEDSIRLMSQRIRVTEQLHVENKESYKITKERLEQENRILEARTCEYSRLLSTLDTATTRLKNVAEGTNIMLSGVDLVCKHFEERNGRMMQRMSKFSEEVGYVKKWVVGTKKVNELLKGEMGGLAEQLQRKEENESILRERISVLLESKGENMSLVKALEQVEEKMRGLQRMVKEKESGIMDICEEKREAIRQLCVLIDYQKNLTDHFKQIIIQNHIVTTPRKC